MTDFGDDLRALLAKKKEQFFVREMQEERQRQALIKLRDDTRRAAARLAREVFRPLLEEFREVMEAAGVLCGGTVEEVGSQESEAGSQIVRLRAAGTAPGSPHYEIRAACLATGDGRIDVTLSCLDRTAAEFGQGAGRTEQGVQGREQGAGSREHGVCSYSPLPAPGFFLPAPRPLLPASHISAQNFQSGSDP